MQLLDKYQRLVNMLRYCRPAWSKTEEKFIADFILPYNPRVDYYGNYWIEVMNGDKVPTTMFTAHTDSVHFKDGEQKLSYDPTLKQITSDGECLGADDATGIAIMLEMIDANIPGVYVFFRAEEIGGKGSAHAFKFEQYWKQCTRCISFDRTSYEHSIITYQGTRCCSDVFAQALADQMKLPYILDDGGIFTDSANFTSAIPECTNISVGYFNEHTENEYQDLQILDDLMDSLLEIDFEALPVMRDPLEVDEYAPWYGTYGLLDKPDDLAGEIKEIFEDENTMISNDLDAFLKSKGAPPLYDELVRKVATHFRNHGIKEDHYTIWFEDQLANGGFV